MPRQHVANPRAASQAVSFSKRYQQNLIASPRAMGQGLTTRPLPAKGEGLMLMPPMCSAFPPCRSRDMRESQSTGKSEFPATGRHAPICASASLAASTCCAQRLWEVASGKKLLWPRLSTRLSSTTALAAVGMHGPRLSTPRRIVSRRLHCNPPTDDRSNSSQPQHPPFNFRRHSTT